MHFYYTEPLENNEAVSLFSGVAIPSELSVTDAGETFSVTVTAEAVQSDNFTPDFSADSPWGEIDIQECMQEGTYSVESSGSVQSLIIEYQGSSDELVTNADDFFQNFPVLMPGDSYSDTVTVFNDSDADTTLYFASLVSEESELLDEVQLSIVYTVDDEETAVYSGEIRAESLSDLQEIGTVPAGNAAEFEFSVSLPETADNSYASLDGAVEWIFSTTAEEEEITDGPQTGDNGRIGLSLIVMGICAGVCAFVVRGRKQKDEAAV